MGFDIASDVSCVTLEDEDEVLFDLPARFRIPAPEWRKLAGNRWSSPTLSSPEQVRQFRSETSAVRDAYEAALRQELVKSRRIHAKDGDVLERILAPMLAADHRLAKLAALIAVCDDALAGSGVLRCLSD